MAVLASKAVPLEAARPQAPQPVRITVCRDGGGSAAVPLTVSPEVRGPPPAALSHRRAAPPRNHEAHATGAVSGASNCSGGGMERGSRRNQKGDTAEADDNAGAGRAGGGAAGAAAAHDAPSGADDCPLARREWGVSARGAGVCQGDAHAAAPMAAPPLAGATNGALAEGEVRTLQPYTGCRICDCTVSAWQVLWCSVAAESISRDAVGACRRRLRRGGGCWRGSCRPRRTSPRPALRMPRCPSRSRPTPRRQATTRRRCSSPPRRSRQVCACAIVCVLQGQSRRSR